MTNNTTEPADAGDDEPEWKQEEVLRDHVEAGETYEEIADQYDGATASRVGAAVRRHDITTKHHQPKYSEGEVPVRFIDGIDVEHPLPVNIAQKYGVEGGTPLRFRADPEENDLSVIVETGDYVTGEWAHERRATNRGTMYPTVRYPRRLAHALGLADLFGGVEPEAAEKASDDEVEFTGSILGDDPEEFSLFNEDEDEIEEAEMDVTATFEEVDEHSFRVTFDPAPVTWEPIATAGPPDELESTEKTLTANWPSTLTVDERTPANPSIYHLYFPLEWSNAYGLDDVEDVGQYLGHFDDEEGNTHFGLVINFAEDQHMHPGLRTGVHTSQKGVKGVAERDVQVVFPVKSLLNTLGIGVSDKIEKVNVRLVPGENWVGIVPA